MEIIVLGREEEGGVRIVAPIGGCILEAIAAGGQRSRRGGEESAQFCGSPAKRGPLRLSDRRTALPVQVVGVCGRGEAWKCVR